MNYNILGNTGLKVSRLCFGALTIGPLQKNLTCKEGAAVIRTALDGGVNFIDTAELYGTYGHIGQAVRGHSGAVVISAKSYAYSYEGMRKSVEKACRETGRGHIDIFGLHEQTSRLTLKGHAEALRYLADAKKAGLVRAVSVSTHYVEVVRVAAMLDEVDVIHPLINKAGLGIADGSREDMLAAMEFAAYMGKGLYAMKILGGGHLSGESEEAFSWALSLPGVASVAVGMRDAAEVKVNCAIFSGEAPDRELAGKVRNLQRDIFVEEYCIGCGACAARCSSGALDILDGRAVIDSDKCVRCGYCASVCPHFCIKVV